MCNKATRGDSFVAVFTKCIRVGVGRVSVKRAGVGRVSVRRVGVGRVRRVGVGRASVMCSRCTVGVSRHSPVNRKLSNNGSVI